MGEFSAMRYLFGADDWHTHAVRGVRFQMYPGRLLPAVEQRKCIPGEQRGQVTAHALVPVGGGVRVDVCAAD